MRNKALQKLSKKNLIRHLEAAEDQYLDLLRSHQLAVAEGRRNFGRFATALAAQGGSVTITDELLESMPESLSDVVIKVDEHDDRSRTFRIEGYGE